MKTRIISAIVMIALFVPLLIIGEIPYLVMTTILAVMGLYELKTFKNRNEKRKVEITMDNTSTAIVRTTLFEGEMVFPKSGTYEIK